MAAYNAHNVVKSAMNQPQPQQHKCQQQQQQQQQQEWETGENCHWRQSVWPRGLAYDPGFIWKKKKKLFLVIPLIYFDDNNNNLDECVFILDPSRANS